MEISELNNKTTIKISQELLKELNREVSKIVSDNSLEEPLAIEEIILSLENKKYEFEISIGDYEAVDIKVEQINHRSIIEEDE
jgi:hypothetical protein